MRRPDYRSGNVVGSSTLRSHLGSGGNAEVWAVEPSGDVAIKISRARNPKSEPYRRFRDEVTILREVGAKPGVLPLIEADIPRRPTKTTPAWFTMPRATRIRDALADYFPIDVVAAVRDIAVTLSELAQVGVHHRDIKPDNMFRLKDTFVIGDFGLATFPDKEAITEAAGRIGPANFLAPELLTSAGAAEGGPADVWMLAKSLWVLVTNQNYPPLGEQRTDRPPMLLSQYVKVPRVELLDRLIERATQYEPAQRPTMVEFADELEAFLGLEAPPVAADDDLSDLAARIKPLTSDSMREAQLRDLAQIEASKLYNRLLSDLRDIEKVVSSVGLPAKVASSQLHANRDAGALGAERAR